MPFSVNVSRRTVLFALHAYVLGCCVSEMPQYLSFKVLILNSRAFNEHIYGLDVTGGDFSSLSLELCLCVCSNTDEQYLLQNHGYCKKFAVGTNISWCS